MADKRLQVRLATASEPTCCWKLLSCKYPVSKFDILMSLMKVLSFFFFFLSPWK